ncbi:TolC family protein [Mucilaginibacter myungsuensis]|uniref:TolC family protein n=1 Tax=Mucilaginibacter myungsuensis TaxID=649104 RepID=A0A929PWQ1_9SPHI|nr:TolC family protein [Mucilaginibacter myungsuensis]MBE9661417.1 TolC family protein [Mucilaginibacter myungsuensis]MDN3597560.1 TolC family protein [Mucilaginibacter myungsuensis]
MSTTLRTLLIGSVLVSTNVFAQEKITLEQAIDSAVTRNIQVRQARFDEAISYENVKLAKGSTLPTLNGSLATYRLFGRTVDPTTSQFTGAASTIAQGNLFADVTLFQGFAKMNDIKQSKYLLEANKNQVAKIKNDLTLLVLYTYLRVLSNRDLLAAAKQQLIFAKEEVERQQKFFKVGQKTLADLSQAKSQVANAESNQTNAQNEMERAYLTLAHAMERDRNKPFLVVDPAKDQVEKLNLAYTAPDVYQAALQNYPDILLATNNRLAAEKAVDAAKGRQYPILSLAGGLTSSYSSSATTLLATQITGTVPIGVVANTDATVLAPIYGNRPIPFGDQLRNNFTQVAGLSLSIPIANGFRSNINIRKAKLAHQNALATEELTKSNIDKTVAEAVWDVHATQKRYQAALVTFKSAQDAFKVMRDRYTVGLVNSLDINIAATERNSAEFALIQTKYELILKSKVIDYYLGNKIKFD